MRATSHKLAINRLIALITNEVVKGHNNRAEVEAFQDGIDTILALGRSVTVIRAYWYTSLRWGRQVLA